MTKSLKLLLLASALTLAASLTNAGSEFAWGALKPVSAILFLVFFIGQLFHKEMALYDEESRLRLAKAQPAAPQRVKSKGSTSQNLENHSVAPAH
jgi:hypothetical protein